MTRSTLLRALAVAIVHLCYFVPDSLAACPPPAGQAAKTYEIRWRNPISDSFGQIYSGDVFNVVWNSGTHNVLPLPRTGNADKIALDQVTCQNTRSSSVCNFVIPDSYSCGEVIALYCSEHPSSMFLTIKLGNSTAQVSTGLKDPNQYRIAHGAMMFLAFGIFLPIGGFLAQSGRINMERYHRYCQSFGIILGIIGYIVISAGLGQGSHFNYPHSIVGIVLVALAFVVQPIAVWLSVQKSVPELKEYRSMFRSLHRRNGQMLVFFGIANIFLGLLALDAATENPTYTQSAKVAYGVVVGLMIMMYMLFQPKTATFKRGETFRAAFAPKHGADDASDPLTSKAPRNADKEAAAGESEMKDLLVADVGFADVSTAPSGSAAAHTIVEPERALKPQFDDAVLQSILEATQDAIVGADGAGNISSWNDAACNMFGYTKEEAVGQSLQILMPSHYKNRHQSALDATTEEAEQAKKKGGRAPVKKYDKIYSVRGLAKNGMEFPIEISVTSFMLGGKLRYNSIIKDMSSADYDVGFIPEDSQERVDVAKTANQLLKEKAVKLGAMMQTAHGLSSNLFITKQELAGIINKGMVEAKLESNAEFRKQKCEGVAAAIMEDASRDQERVFFVDLIPMLLKRGITVTDQGALQLQSSRLRKDVKTPYEKFVSDSRKFLKSNKLQIVWMFGLFSINLILFLTAFFEFRDKGANEWIQVARGGGRMLNFDCAIIVLPMCRKAMGYLRTTIMRKFTPFDESIEFHKVIAYYILFATIVHTVAHFGNYLTPTMAACPRALAAKFDNFTAQGGVGTGNCKFSFWLFDTQPGLTGFLLLLTMVFIYGGANETIRRGGDAQRSAPPPAAAAPTRRTTAAALLKQMQPIQRHWRQIYSHSVFFFTHHLFIVFFILILIHGYGLEAVIGNPNFYKYFLACAPIYLAERFIRDGLAKREDLVILKAVTLPGKVTALYVQKPKIWNVKAGMYLFIQVPEISSFEWHPFTITSAPEDPFVSIHVKSAGDWTGDLYKMFSENNHDALSSDSTNSNFSFLPIARIDGPYGAPTQEVFQYKTAVVVGAGIGATPSISILRHILWKLKLNDPVNVPSLEKTIADATVEELTEALERKKSDPLFTLKKLYFIWSNRDAEAFQWFAAVLGSIESHPAVDIRAFLTSSSLGKDDLNAFLLRIGMETQVERGGADVVTSLKSVVTQYRRPDFHEFFREITPKHPAEKIGVFFCGPTILGESIRLACEDVQAENVQNGMKTKFSFNMEVF